jgi:uncharacterized protein (UPF0276 family)
MDGTRTPSGAIAADRAGVGLKPGHVADILASRPPVGFFEIHAENYMGSGGLPHAQLRAIGALYPLSIHGVGASIGGAGPLDRDHLARLKALDERYAPALFSEHLAWSTHDGHYLNDLLPLPYTRKTLARVVEHVDEIQSCLGRRLLLENPSAYVVFDDSTMSEVDFLRDVAQRSGCGLLLDLNNVFVSAANHGFSPQAYLAAFPLDLVGEVHLGGHVAVSDAGGTPLLIDTHDRGIDAGVWTLYAETLRRIGPCPTLIEWDADVPAWPQLEAEARRAGAEMAKASAAARAA